MRRVRRARMDNDVCGEITGAMTRNRACLLAIRILYRRLSMLAAHVRLPLLFAVAFLSPSPSFGQLNVITSVGFAAAHNELVPVFQKSSGITVSTKALRLARQWTRYHSGTTPRRCGRGRRHYEQGRARQTPC